MGHTSRDAVDLVPDKKVDQRNESSEEGTSQVLPVLDSCCIWWAQDDASGRPRDRQDKVRDHQNVMPVVVVGRRDVCPAAACQGPHDAHHGNCFREAAIGPLGEEIP